MSRVSHIGRAAHSKERSKGVSHLYELADYCKDFLAYYQHLMAEVRALCDHANPTRRGKDHFTYYKYLLNEVRNLNSYTATGEGLLSGYYMMKLTSVEPIASQYHGLKHLRRALDKAFTKGNLSEAEYNSRTEELDRKVKDCEAEHVRWLTHTYQDYGFSPPKVQAGHIVLALKCTCGWEGSVSSAKSDARLLGKNTIEGYTYFQCPACTRHLEYCWLSGRTRIRKGLLGLLFGRFS